MNRHQLATECLRIEKSGGSVREFLSGMGCVSPWGTWFRLQKEELGRKDWQITDGKGREEMKKLTLEDKKEAVRIAVEGGNPMQFLKERGITNTQVCWAHIRKALKESDPETFAKIPDLRGNRTKPDETEEPEKPEKPAACEDTEDVFRTTAIVNDDMGEFSLDLRHGLMFWRTPNGEEVGMEPGMWHRMAQALPKVLRKLRI